MKPFVFLCLLHLIATKQTITECERSCHVGFTAAQKRQICQSRTDRIGAALCANHAKTALHLSFDDTLTLCKDASSIAPSKCYEKVPSKYRKEFGVALCSQAATVWPGDCFQELVGLNGASALKNKSSLVEFCVKHSADGNSAPLDCIKASMVQMESHTNSDSQIESITDDPESGFIANKKLYAPLFPSLKIELLAACGDAISSRETSHCIREMVPFKSPSLGLNSADIIDFCATAVEADNRTEESLGFLSPLAECFLRSSAVTAKLTLSQRISLCKYSSDMLPVQCAQYGLNLLLPSPRGSVSGKPSVDDVLQLCQASPSSSAPVSCFQESKGLGDIPHRITLCRGSLGVGPATCTRLASQQFRMDPDKDYNIAMLCGSADNEGPATCVQKTPYYLSFQERVQICSRAPQANANDPNVCLSSVEKTFKLFSGVNQKVLGYVADTLIRNPADLTLRSRLINLCSFSHSQNVLASAECFKSTTHTMSIGEAISVCTDVSSSEVASTVSLCARVLPKDWTIGEVSVLCGHAKERRQAEEAVRCATALAVLPNGKKLAHHRVAELCQFEPAISEVVRNKSIPQGSRFGVERCVKEACSSGSLSRPNAKLLSSSVLVTVCGQQQLQHLLSLADASSLGNGNPHGACLTAVSNLLPSLITLDESSVVKICHHFPHSPSMLVCLSKLQSKVLTEEDIDECGSRLPEPKLIRITRLQSSNEEFVHNVMAGRRFSVVGQMIDQWGEKLTTVRGHERGDWTCLASINQNNPQGAVLWGVRSNTTFQGELKLDNLVISQPGTVELKIVYRASTASTLSSSISNSEIVLGIFTVTVIPDPSIDTNSEECLFVFREGLVAKEVDSDDVQQLESLKQCNLIRGQNPASLVGLGGNRRQIYFSQNYFYRFLMCSAVLESWNVTLSLEIPVDDSVEPITFGHSVDYKEGIDFIWTGIGFPNAEMTLEERLGLVEPGQPLVKYTARQVRKAYYKMSLLWHPDKWMNYPLYTTAVQGAFELISEAYSQLISEFKKDT